MSIETMVRTDGQIQSETIRWKRLSLLAAVGSFLLTIFGIFYFFVFFHVEPIPSAFLAIIGGSFVLWILIRGNLFEATSGVDQKIDSVHQDVKALKKELEKNISVLDRDIETLNNKLDNLIGIISGRST